MITSLDKNTALIVIDLQNGIIKQEFPQPAENILEQVRILADAFHLIQLPIFWVTVNPLGAAWTKTRVENPSVPQNPITRSIAKAALTLTGFTTMARNLPVLKEDVQIRKRTWNAFFETNLDQELKQRNISGIVLCGISTSIGVEGTARNASELGYNISFATDAMTDKSLSAHQNSLANIFPRIGELGTVCEIMDYLNKKGA